MKLHDAPTPASSLAGSTCAIRVAWQRVADNTSAAAHSLVRQTAARATGMTERNISLDHDPDGRLKVLTGSQEVMPAALTHTRGLVACVIGQTHAVGIDAEPLARRVSRTRIANRYFAPNESAALSALADNEAQREFLQLWTAKEAAVKALRIRLGEALAHVHVAREQEGPKRLVSRFGDLGVRWFYPDDEFVLCVCWDAVGPEATFIVNDERIPPADA